MRGVSLVELVIVLLVTGILLGVAWPRAAGWSDRLAVMQATDDVAVFYHAVRQIAVLRGARVRVEFTADSLVGVAEEERDTVVLRRPGPARLGVVFSASRARIAVGTEGLGFGAANTKLVFRRGRAADSLTIGRLGRLKRF